MAANDWTKADSEALCAAAAIVSEASASLSTVGAALQAVAGRIAAMGVPVFLQDSGESAVAEFRAGTVPGLRVEMELGKPCVLSVPISLGDPR